MESNIGFGFLIGLVVGAAAMYFWASDPLYIETMKEQVQNGFGPAVALHKAGSGQVAVIHGFVDDFDVCHMIRLRLETDGGIYSCQEIPR